MTVEDVGLIFAFLLYFSDEMKEGMGDIFLGVVAMHCDRHGHGSVAVN